MRPTQTIVADIDTANQSCDVYSGEWHARQSALASLAVELADAVRPRPIDDSRVTAFLDWLPGTPFALAVTPGESDIYIKALTVPEAGPAIVELDNGDRYEIGISKVEIA